MDVVEHSLFPKLVKVYLYERNIAAHGGVVQDGKLLTPGTNGCLLSHHTIDSEAPLWWRCERWPDFIYHQHQMSPKDKIATFGQGCDKCRKLIVVSGKFSSVPEVQAYWDWEGNSDVTPDKVSRKTKTKVNLICASLHKYKASCGDFTFGYRCGFCSGRYPISGINTFDTVPDALEWWDTEENDKIGLKITDLTRSGYTKVNIICPLGHKYKIRCNNFASGSRCGICAGKSPLPGFNTAETIPDINEWWNYERNNENGIFMTKVLKGGSTKVHMRCPNCSYEYIQEIYSFYKGFRCGSCANNITKKGINTFDTVPDALEWWDYEKNTINIYDIGKNSKSKVWLKCPLSHSFEVRCHRFNVGDRCPYCSGRRPLAGFNTFDTVPDALEWWDTEENDKIGLKITDLTKGSRKVVNLKCPKGHKYLTPACDFNSGYRCARCAKSGYSRQALEYISCIESKYNINIQHAENEGEFRIPNSLYRADGYVEINGEKIVIEYHGDLFHGYKGLIKQNEMSYLGKTFGELYQKTLTKEAKIRELGYTLVVIWESDYLAARDKYLSGDFAIPEIEAALAKK
ncbi:hypothetical protein D5b_00282 [Faustovirus]|nr:hypothetical protein D5b_00282 [Faustovirus]AMN84630.1 hypothetical protein D6_00227 [Faustovirus]AMP44234.1 hypothetical protein PRJ_Dakar_00279 [Faustovirus]